MAKRHRYIVDYLNSIGLHSALLQTRTNNDIFKNPIKGQYGKANYFNANYYWHKGIIGKVKYYIKSIRFILFNFDKSKTNIIIFPSVVSIDILPFYVLIKFLNYKIFFDVVENYLTQGNEASLLLKLSSKFSKHLYKNSTGIFVISTNLKMHLNSLTNNIPICLLTNSSPIDKLNSKKQFSTPIRILYSGTFAKKDGLDYFIAAYKLFCKLTNKKTELILTGIGDKENMSNILHLIKDCKNIKYIGFINEDELKQLINNSDILTMTRINSEFANFGFPFKLSEYLASGNTVLATKVGDVPLYLSHMKNAYLVDPDKPDDLIMALQYLTQNENIAVKIGKNGPKVVQEKFDLNKNGELFVNFLIDSLKNKKH